MFNQRYAPVLVNVMVWEIVKTEAELT